MYLETHCNIGSKSVFHRRTRQVTQLFTYLLTHNLFSSCIRRYLVSRACDWVMPALSAVLLIFSFQFSLLFFNISLARPHQHCSVLLVLTRNIGHRTLPKIWVGAFLVRNVQISEMFELILTVKMETRHTVGGSFGSEFWAPLIIAKIWRPEVARSRNFVSIFLRFLKNNPLW